MNVLRTILCCLILQTTYIVIAEQCKQMSPEVLHAIEEVIDEIYHLNTQEIQEIVCQDFGCIPQITAEELKQKQDTNEHLVVINVLPEKWYIDCHITGSINIPLKELIYRIRDWNRSQEIVVYCALDACDAGEKAYVLLRCMGFERVFDYPGGIKEWFQLGYPVEGPCASWYLHEKVCRHFDCTLHEEGFDFKLSLKQTRLIKRFKSRDDN